VCYGAEKHQMAGRTTTHKPGSTCAVSCERALKSAGEQNTHGGSVRETARAKEVILRGNVERRALCALLVWCV
jgi:hypothetical protein